MTADEALHHRVYSWSDTDDIRAVFALQAEVQRLRELNDHATSERVRLAQQVERLATAGRGVEAKLARFGTLLAELPSTRFAPRDGSIEVPVMALEAIRDVFLGEP